MAWGLPKQPGMSFSDPTKNRFHVRQSLKYCNGYAFPETRIVGSGGFPTDVESTAYNHMDDSCNYDPSLTYGRVKQPAPAAVIPHFVHYDKKCLKFSAFMKQPVFESQDEAYRVRQVDIIYFLEDDTITVMEPRVHNSGLWQGRLVKRGKIPKNNLGDAYHWKDLNIGKDLPMYGKVFHTVSCDLFTEEYMASQGVELQPFEEMPADPYTDKKRWRETARTRVTKMPDDPLRRYLEWNGKVLRETDVAHTQVSLSRTRITENPDEEFCQLHHFHLWNGKVPRFDCVWDDRDSEHGELRDYRLLYFLQDDTVSIKECHDSRGGRDPFPLMLKKTKLPKKWKERPVSFPSIALETTAAEVSEYYAPRDFVVGATVFVLGRRFLLYDCDEFTRHYYRTMLSMEQPARIAVRPDVHTTPTKVLPPHIGIGSAEDALQSCFSLMPKPPKKDIIKYNLNANKNLRYLCELDYIHPEDAGRLFVLAYSLADGTVRIGEVPRRNSGIREGTFLSRRMLQTPDSDPNFPTYYTPEQFFIGAIVHVFKHRFRIIGCDLYVYRYMCANADKFPRDVVDNVRNYHLREGNLKIDLKEAEAEEEAAAREARLAAIGSSAVAAPSRMQQCLDSLGVVEGSAAPPRPPTPPPTTDRLSYDDTLRIVRDSAPTCDNLKPLKGILKSGEARDDRQKVVCFNAPAPPSPSGHEAARAQVHSQMAPAEGFCDQFRDPEREARRASGVCPYPPVPSSYAKGEAAREDPTAGTLAQSYGVDCAETPDYMRLAERTSEPAADGDYVASPAAQRTARLPGAPAPPPAACREPPPPPPGVCPPRRPEDVTFECPHEPLAETCCDPDKRVGDI